jgi:hypothetical protein
LVCGSVTKKGTVIRERFAIASLGLEHGPENMRFARAARSRDDFRAKQSAMPAGNPHARRW